MKKFKVTIAKTVVKSYVIEVEAEDKDDAKEAAWDEIWEKEVKPRYERTMDTNSWAEEV
jgi:hypothetical protein